MQRVEEEMYQCELCGGMHRSVLDAQRCQRECYERMGEEGRRLGRYLKGRKQAYYNQCSRAMRTDGVLAPIYAEKRILYKRLRLLENQQDARVTEIFTHFKYILAEQRLAQSGE